MKIIDSEIRSLTYLQYTVHIFGEISTMSFSCLLLFIVFLQFAQSPVTHLLIPLLCVFQLRPDNYIVAYCNIHKQIWWEKFYFMTAINWIQLMNDETSFQRSHPTTQGKDDILQQFAGQQVYCQSLFWVIPSCMMFKYLMKATLTAIYGTHSHSACASTIILEK